MATFAITPATGYPIPPSEDFPQFIQMQADGTNLGGPDVDTLNFSTNLVATRGTGENSATVTVTATGGGSGSALQFQSGGVDLGGPDATTVNFINGLEGDRVGATVQIFPSTPVFNWNIVDIDNYLINSGDVNNGIFITGAITNILIPAQTDEVIPIGFPITIVSDVDGEVNVQGNTGAVVIKVPITKEPIIASTCSTVTLRRYADDTWILTGDLGLT